MCVSTALYTQHVCLCTHTPTHNIHTFLLASPSRSQLALRYAIKGSAVTMSTASPEEMISKKIAISNSVGEVLVGILDDTGSKELAIFCHGFRSSKEYIMQVNLSSALLETGLSTFRFDFSGNGESQGEFQFGNYWKEVEDLRAVVLYWLDQGRNVKAIIGHSKGANVVLLYASKYGDVHKVVNLSGRYALERGIKEQLGDNFFQRIEEEGFWDVKDKSGNLKYRITKECLQDRLNIDMKLAASSIIEDCRVLTVHGSKDEIIDVEDAYEFDKLVPSHVLQIVEGADHVYSKHQKELATIVVGFIQNDHEN